MPLFTIEQSPRSYIADFVVYGLAVGGLATFLALKAPAYGRGLLVLLVLCGLCGWTLVEYLLHRFVLHGVPLFRAMHAMHHHKPRALIGTPTLVTAFFFVASVFLPAVWLTGVPKAVALLLGVLLGYMVYSFIHHGVHHWSGGSGPLSGWFKQRKLRHGLHHESGAARYYGVSTSFWDGVFRTTHTPAPVFGKVKAGEKSAL